MTIGPPKSETVDLHTDKAWRGAASYPDLLSFSQFLDAYEIVIVHILTQMLQFAVTTKYMKGGL